MPLEPKFAKRRFQHERVEIIVKSVTTGARVCRVAKEGGMSYDVRQTCIAENMRRATHKVRERTSTQWNRGVDATVKNAAKNRKVNRMETATNQFVSQATALQTLSKLLEDHKNAKGKRRSFLRGKIRSLYRRAGHKVCPV